MKKILSLLLLITFLGCDEYETSVNERFKKSMETYPKDFIINDSSNFDFYVVADSHYPNKKIELLYKTELNKNNKLFMAGDITDNSSIFEIYNFIEDSQNYNIYGVIGNHDIGIDIDIWFDTLGPTVYKYEIGKVLIVVLDTASGKLGNMQIRWLKKILNNNLKYKIIITHIAPWKLNKEWDSEFLIDICKKYKVNLYINGHSHQYKENIINDTNFVQVSSIRFNKYNYLLKVLIKNDNLYWEIIK